MKTKLFGIIISTMLLTSCATYYLTPQSLRNQLQNAHPDGNSNGISKINCVDKDGKEKVLVVTNHTGIRITKKDDTKKTFVFMTAYIQDSLLKGCSSAILGIPIKPIKISDIKKIELQH